jgi:hypothetical protein
MCFLIAALALVVALLAGALIAPQPIVPRYFGTKAGETGGPL